MADLGLDRIHHGILKVDWPANGRAARQGTGHCALACSIGGITLHKRAGSTVELPTQPELGPEEPQGKEPGDLQRLTHPSSPNSSIGGRYEVRSSLDLMPNLNSPFGFAASIARCDFAAPSEGRSRSEVWLVRNIVPSHLLDPNRQQTPTSSTVCWFSASCRLSLAKAYTQHGCSQASKVGTACRRPPAATR